jgi:uncharacterized protein YndB with AHSA1/START domain
MAIAVTIETHVARPPADVFDALTAIDGWPAWLIATGIVRVTRSSAAALVPGEQVTIDQRAAGRASVVEARVTALARPTRFAIEGRDADGVTTTLDARLAEAGDGGTSLRWSVRIGLPLRYRVFESLAAPQVQRAAALDIEALRRRLETTPAG